MNQTDKMNYCEGLRDGVPIALGYLAVAFTLGIAARNFGIHAFPATIMSLTNFTSAGEFAALGIISAGAPYLEMVFSQAIINLDPAGPACDRHGRQHIQGKEVPQWLRLNFTCSSSGCSSS